MNRCESWYPSSWASALNEMNHGARHVVPVENLDDADAVDFGSLGARCLRLTNMKPNLEFGAVEIAVETRREIKVVVGHEPPHSASGDLTKTVYAEEVTGLRQEAKAGHGPEPADIERYAAV